MLFKWYAVDFGRKTVNRLEWICQYLTGEDKQKLDSLILSGRYKVKFAAYNWDTNNRYDTETERSDGTDTISESGPPTPVCIPALLVVCCTRRLYYCGCIVVEAETAMGLTMCS